MLRPGCLWKVAGMVLKRPLWRLILGVWGDVNVPWSPHLLDRSEGLADHLSALNLKDFLAVAVGELLRCFTFLFKLHSDGLCSSSRHISRQAALKCWKTVGFEYLSVSSNRLLAFLWQECFTYVLKGHIAVSAAVFPTGTKGRSFIL